jgi:hypothetical protein
LVEVSGLPVCRLGIDSSIPYQPNGLHSCRLCGVEFFPYVGKEQGFLGRAADGRGDLAVRTGLALVADIRVEIT